MKSNILYMKYLHKSWFPTLIERKKSDSFVCAETLRNEAFDILAVGKKRIDLKSASSNDHLEVSSARNSVDRMLQILL